MREFLRFPRTQIEIRGDRNSKPSRKQILMQRPLYL